MIIKAIDAAMSILVSVAFGFIGGAFAIRCCDDWNNTASPPPTNTKKSDKQQPTLLPDQTEQVPEWAHGTNDESEWCICPNCDHQRFEETNFCPDCGKKLRKTNERK